MKKLLFIAGLMLLASCNKKSGEERLKIVCTTTMITDLVKNIAGDKVEVQGLMGAGVDPHLYKATEGDVGKITEADIIFYNGLHLEGKLSELLEGSKGRGKNVVALGDAADRSQLISSSEFVGNYDPHIWFDPAIWIDCAAAVSSALSQKDPQNAQFYETQKDKYVEQLSLLREQMRNDLQDIPQEQRILVTAHDAFNYFGKAFEFEVVGLQGLSTASEAGVRDVQDLAEFIVSKRVKAIFVETSIPRRNIEALQAAVRSRGFEVAIGGELFSDALGSTGTVEGTYIGMMNHNYKTILKALE